ncbi:tetratricopeptide repeat protein [Methylomonas sp. LL1]|uniref:tetratricopeptide repeat protein n=1 Tax=Methylomonas sp. LL1 TaxID=2785785 RepID=UPI0018C3F1D6|nr:tetratricopeptide repeat protein [Methylomonas sp. LL1]QPK63330.1 tetratricopeptide repeat protein [Methylomonas sp. LL1]
MNQPIDIQDSSEAVSQTLSFDQALELAIRLHYANRLEHAEEIYCQLLEIAPEHADLMHFFGLLKHQRGYSEEGIAWIKNALLLAPDYLDAENNLGNIYLQLGHSDLAEPCFRRVVEHNPGFAAAHGNLGIVLRHCNRFDEAIESLLTAIELEPEAAHHYQNLGNVYRSVGDYPAAVNHYRKSLVLKPADAEAYSKLCRTLYLLGDIEQCVDTLREWLAHEPENPLARHMYSAYTRDKIPDRASDAYVRQTFDRFAASFDGVLNRLDYQAPFLVTTALQQLNQDTRAWHLLDAGCGTGLFGALAKPLVKRLDGVDLSPKMLERALARNVYTDLFEAELTEFLAKNVSMYDCISCVDTLCYFGDLNDVTAAASNALKYQGWFIFTVEKQQETGSDEGFHLNAHGRYSHTEIYLRNVLSQAGFTVRHFDTEVLRMEGGAPVIGFVITAQAIS